MNSDVICSDEPPLKKEQSSPKKQAAPMKLRRVAPWHQCQHPLRWPGCHLEKGGQEKDDTQKDIRSVIYLLHYCVNLGRGPVSM